MTWMSATTVCQATLADFARLLDLSVVDPSDSSYFRIHEPGQRQLSAKPHLYHCYDSEADGSRYAPNVKYMSPKYYALHRVLRQTIHVKFGERNLVRGWLINLLFYLERKKEQGVKLDVMHYMLSEMRLCVLKKKVPIYAPYLQLLIEEKVTATSSSLYPLTAHKPLNMNFHGDDDDPPPPKCSKPTSHDEGTSSAHPSSTPKTTWKSIFKSMNCFGIDMQKRVYEA